MGKEIISRMRVVRGVHIRIVRGVGLLGAEDENVEEERKNMRLDAERDWNFGLREGAKAGRNKWDGRSDSGV